MPARLDPILVLNQVSRSIKRGMKLIEKVDQDALWSAIQTNDAMAAFDMFYGALGLDD